MGINPDAVIQICCQMKIQSSKVYATVPHSQLLYLAAVTRLLFITEDDLVLLNKVNPKIEMPRSCHVKFLSLVLKKKI